MFDVITIGGLSRDVFFEVSSLKIAKASNHLDEDMLMVPYGAKIVADSTYYSYGGGAFNVPVALKKLGLKTATVCNIGKEGTGSLALKKLHEKGVNTKFVQRSNIYHTGLSIFLIGRDGEHAGFLERGANNHLSIKKISALKKTRWFYISSLTGDSTRNLEPLFKFAKDNKIRIAFNPGSRQLKLGYAGLKDYLEASDLLLLNLEEAELLVKSMKRKTPKNISELLVEVDKLGSTITVVTDAGKGSYAVFEGKDYHQTSFPVEVADTTGAGDAFGATLLFGIIKGFDLQYALKIAAINSAAVVSKMGATEGLLNYNKIKSSKWL